MVRCIRSRSTQLVLIALVTTMLSGCHIHKPFEPMDDTVTIRPGSLAVISGDVSEATMRLADVLTQQLKDRSTFNVLSQEEIGYRAGKYPVAIKEADAAGDLKPVWFDKSEKAKLDTLQAKVKTDYLFVVWTPYLFRVTNWNRPGGSVSFRVTVNGNLIEYPKGVAVGYTEFVENKSKSCCLFGKSEGNDVNELLHDAASQMADKLISAAKAEKPGK